MARNDKALARRWVSIAGTWAVASGICAIAISYFYGLLGPGILFPFKTHAEEMMAATRTALAATSISVWAIWFGSRSRGGISANLLWAGLGVQATMTLYSILGLQVCISVDSISTELFFPSTFFAEFNWLTFIFEIAPVTALSSCLLLLMTARWRRSAS
jgi:hypothetical protein